jgi:hypothetical protein
MIDATIMIAATLPAFPHSARMLASRDHRTLGACDEQRGGGSEWTLDWRGTPYAMPCRDCTNVQRRHLPVFPGRQLR